MPICANATLQCSRHLKPEIWPGVFDCGGVRSLDFDGNEETGIDGNEIAKMFLDSNPQMAQSFRTIGARGPNVWFITHGPCPSKTWLFDANGIKVADFQAGPGYQIVQGRHPSGVPYRVLVGLA